MPTQSPIFVNFDEFKTAVEQIPKMKRSPAGAKGVIPTDTILTPDHAGVVVETPAIETFVHGSGPWKVSVSVDARKLIELCDRIKKIGATGNQIELSLKERDLWIRYNTTKFSLPTLWVK
jgi:hypothetical protein